MDIRNCKGCGKIFNYVAGPIRCQACRESMEGKFQEVKDYIRSNPGVGIPEVSEACDVDAAQIRLWLKEERLEVTEDSAIFLNCEGCGAPVRCGRYCEKCKYEMTKGFKSILEENKSKNPRRETEDKNNPKMRFL